MKKMVVGKVVAGALLAISFTTPCLPQATSDFRQFTTVFPSPYVYVLPGSCNDSQTLYYAPIRTTLVCGTNNNWKQQTLLESTVATLPGASLFPGLLAKVLDGTSSSDCTVGGGSSTSLCAANSGSWGSIGGGGSGLPSGTGAVKVTSGVGALVSGTSTNCVLVSGASAPCSAGIKVEVMISSGGGTATVTHNLGTTTPIIGIPQIKSGSMNFSVGSFTANTFVVASSFAEDIVFSLAGAN